MIQLMGRVPKCGQLKSVHAELLVERLLQYDSPSSTHRLGICDACQAGGEDALITNTRVCTPPRR